MNIIIEEPATSENDEPPLVSAAVRVAETVYHIWFRASHLPLSKRSDAFLSTALLPAMARGETLRVGGLVSAKFCARLNQIQDIYCCWVKRFRKIAIECQPSSEARRSADRVGCFFSGGLDSWYTLLKHRREITHLIFVHGFDLKLDDLALRQRVASEVRDVAGRLGKALIEIETNSGLKDWIIAQSLCRGSFSAVTGRRSTAYTTTL